MADRRAEFEEAARAGRRGLLREVIGFLRENKKWWIVPIVLVVMILAAIILFSQTSPLAPLLYPLL